jgi:hypothetical protein
MADEIHPYVPPGPLESAPSGGYQPPGVRREALAAVLGDIPLASYDHRMLEWLAGLDDSTCRAFASLMQRCRLAAPPGSVTEWALAYMHRTPAHIAQMHPGRRVVQPYPDEQMARAAVAELRALAPGENPSLACRDIGPWREVADPGNPVAGEREEASGGQS